MIYLQQSNGEDGCQRSDSLVQYLNNYVGKYLAPKGPAVPAVSRTCPSLIMPGPSSHALPRIQPVPQPRYQSNTPNRKQNRPPATPYLTSLSPDPLPAGVISMRFKSGDSQCRLHDAIALPLAFVMIASEGPRSFGSFVWLGIRVSFSVSRPPGQTRVIHVSTLEDGTPTLSRGPVTTVEMSSSVSVPRRSGVGSTLKNKLTA